MNDPDPVTEACERVQRMIDDHASRHEILACLVAAAERVSGPRAVASVLVLDRDGLLRNGASPKLPRDYLNAIDRLKPDAWVGTCAAAAATGSVVITPSFLADGKWSELRHLPLALGFAGAWSMPIKSANDGRVCSAPSAPTTATCGSPRRGSWRPYVLSPRSPPARSMERVGRRHPRRAPVAERGHHHRLQSAPAVRAVKHTRGVLTQLD